MALSATYDKMGYFKISIKCNFLEPHRTQSKIIEKFNKNLKGLKQVFVLLFMLKGFTQTANSMASHNK